MRHKLKPLHEDDSYSRTRPDFVVTDLETIKWTKFLVGGVYGKKDGFRYFKCRKALLHYLFDTYPSCDVFAHFGGRFDFLFFIDTVLQSDDFKLGTIIPRGSGILCFELYRGEEVICFRDSSALFPFGLEKLTVAFGVQHKKQKIDYDKITKVTPQLLEYLEYDCRGLWESVEKFYNWPVVKKAGGAYTLASQAMRVLRTHLKNPINSLSKNLDSKIRRSYYGGRVEIFRPFYKGKKPLHCYDVNSLYPTVMAANAFPNGFSHVEFDYKPDAVGFYFCDVDVPDDCYCPPLGMTNADGKYIFPTGTWRELYSIPEINYARSCGVKIKTYTGYLFHSSGYLFKDFVEELFTIKANAEKGGVDETIAKLLLNSCYGRFGINADKEVVVLDDGSEGLRPLREVSIEGRHYHFMTKPVELETFSNVAVAAYVTAYSRIFMHKNYLKPCGKDLYYTDTDSIFTTKKLPTGNGLGDLKLEYSCKSACFLLPKSYVAEGVTGLDDADKKVTLKGFDKKKIQHFTVEDFYACLEGDLKRLKIVQEPKFCTFKTALRNKEIVTMTKESTRQIRSQYDKRILTKTKRGFETTPIHVG